MSTGPDTADTADTATRVAKLNVNGVEITAWIEARIMLKYAVPQTNAAPVIYERSFPLGGYGWVDTPETESLFETLSEFAPGLFLGFDAKELCAFVVAKSGTRLMRFNVVVDEVKEALSVDPYWKIPEDLNDWLTIMFLMQEKLNDYTFANNGITANDGSVLTSQVFRQETASAKLYPETNKLGPNSNTAQWLSKYWEALHREVIELGEEIPWKWWSKSAIPLPKIHEEIVDVWHFLISITIASGLSAGEIVEAYKRKYRTNIERQKQNYVARGDVAA